MQSCELVTFISALACSLAKCLSNDELSILAASLTQLGDTLATILVSEELKEAKKQKEENKQKEEKNLKVDITAKNLQIEDNKLKSIQDEFVNKFNCHEFTKKDTDR